MTTVAIAGSRALPKGYAPRLLIRFLAALPYDTTILLRRGLTTPPGHFEAQVSAMCEIVGLAVEWRAPFVEPHRRHLNWEIDVEYQLRGRQMTFARDEKLIADADLVLSFVAWGQPGDETSGTAALVEKALQAEKTVYGYILSPEGKLLRSGEHDPSNLWTDKVPMPVG